MGLLRHTVIVTAAVTAAAAAVAVAIPRSVYPSSADDELVSAVLSVTERSDDLAAGTSLLVEWLPARQLVVRGAAGTVTAVHVAPGDDVMCGDPLIQIDGHDLVAYCAPAPMYRTVAAGITGDDVDQFVDFLVAKGTLSDGDPDSDQLTAAIDALRLELGLEATGQMQPADTVWIGESARVGTVDVDVGQLLTGSERIARVDPLLVSARLAKPPPTTDQTWVFGPDASAARVRVDPEGNVTELDELAELLVGLVQGEAPPPTTIDGTIRLDEPMVVIGVPASAIVTDSGDTCVRAIEGEAATPIAVEVVGSSVGAAFVTGALRPGQAVEARPPGDSVC